MSAGKKSIKSAVIGVGYLGAIHARKYAEIEDAELVAVADVIEDRAESVAEECGASSCTDYREMLDKVQAVSIAVPTPEHYCVARDCLEAGLDVLIEKPFTETLEQADGLIELADKKGLVLQVGHLERFNPAIRALRSSIVKPGFCEAHRLASFKERASNVDVILDLMIHDLDVVMSLVKAQVKSVSAMGVPVLSDKIDIANARVEFENGCVGNFTASRVSIGEGMRKIRIFQPESYISIDYQKQKMAVFTLGKGDGEDPMSRIRVEEKKINRQDALREEILSFLESVRTRKDPEASGREARAALKVALMINDCIQKGLPLIKDN